MNPNPLDVEAHPLTKAGVYRRERRSRTQRRPQPDASTLALLVVLALLAPAAIGSAVAQDAADAGRWGAFDADWADHWTERDLGRPPTRYDVVIENGGRVLRAVSESSASLIWHPVRPSTAHAARISWRWKVDRTLSGNTRERVKAGDDYAARVFVAFDSDAAGALGRAICYVWASSEPPGSIYPNPYQLDVATVVLRSGDTAAGRWLSESRDLIEDYRAAFGGAPETIAAVALMTDTDDTGGRAVAWFDDIRFDH